MIDSHCHIGFEQSADDVINRARNAGVTRMLSVACAVSDYDSLLQLLDRYPTIDGSFGIHPEYAADMPSDEDIIKKISAHPRILAIGECGLDYHYAPETRDIQIHAFERQIDLADRIGKPLIIHTREADEDTISILASAARAGKLRAGGVLHCFTGSQALAEQALDIGFYISASGVITFKTADAIRKVFQSVPFDRLLVETDSPYLAPVPYRGKENEPAYVIKTAEKLAEIKGVSVDEIDHITTENYYKLFKVGDKINAG